MLLEDIKLSIIGLGYVGLPLAAEFGKHRPVIGFDINQQRICFNYKNLQPLWARENIIKSNK